MNKLYFLVVIVSLVFTSCNSMLGEPGDVPDSDWPWAEVNPESQGISSRDLDLMVEHIDRNNLAIHSVVIYRNGTIPFEAYFEPYSQGVSHNMKSTSKGVMSALVGIALREGYIGSLDDSVLSYLPDFESTSSGVADITIRDLLTMSAGLRWDENDLNSMYTFFVSRRITSRILNLPVDHEPGQQFNYNTGLTHLLSAVISESSGMTTRQFAEQYLFEPMGIRNVQWETDRDGYHIGGSELFLTSRAMTKFAVMYLNEGRYAGQRIVPRDWVRESTRQQIQGTFHNTPIQYGYLWWLDIGNPLFSYLENEHAFLAMGVHGQRILVHPDLDTVVVITADQADASQCDILIRDFILPAISRGGSE